MPRDGLQQYAPPPGTNGITNYTIESTKYNGFVADVTQDLNLPRPIVAGGTGANNAHDAMIALSGEIANQGNVTNFDTFPFVAGSWWAAAGATAGPPSGGTTVSHFYGICYMLNSNTFAIEARELGSGKTYVREKSSGTWGLWTPTAGSTADLDAAYVNVAGDTMSGTLTINTPSNSLLQLISPVPNINVIRGVKGAGLNRWEMYLGDGTAESGGNAGSDFQLVRIDDTGTTNLGTVLAVNRATGAWTMNGTINMSGSASIGGNLTVTGTISSTAKGHLLGVAGGVGSSGAVPITDANILLYNFGANNWAGLGADGGGNLWFKAGTSGTPQASLYINATNQSVVTNYNLNVTANIGVGFLGTAGNILFGNAGAALGFNGTDFVFSNPTAVNQAPTAASHLTNKNYVDTRPGAIRAACLIDIFGGRGFSLGIAATTDAGIGYTDVSYNFAFSSLVNNCVTASISVLATNMAMNMSTPAANSIRLHAITATTAVLTDPQYYHLHATGS